MTIETTKIPKGALHFMDHAGTVNLKFEEGEEAPTIEMVGYSGDIIRDHWWWGDLMIDLDGMSFPKSKYPILEGHMTSSKIAFTGKPIITEDKKLMIDPKTTVFVDTEESEKFLKVSKKGFPYEASIYAIPSTIEQVGKGDIAEVNGRKMKGPGNIWRKSTFKEVSVVVFGYDSNTKAAAFGQGEMELSLETLGTVSSDGNNINTKEVNNVTFELNKFKEDNPNDYKVIEDAIMAEATTKFQGGIGTLEKDNKSLTEKLAEKETELTKKETENQGMADRVLKLEKVDAIRGENELSTRADQIWSEKLSASTVAENLYDKCRIQVTHSKFIKDGNVDWEKFSEAVDAEIVDWVAKGATTSVLGMGVNTKESSGDSDEQKLQEKADDDMADGLYNFAPSPDEENNET